MSNYVEGIALIEKIPLEALESKFPDTQFQLYEIDDTGLILLDKQGDHYPFTTGVVDLEEGIYPIPEHLSKFRKACRKLGIDTPYLPKSLLELSCFLSKEGNTKVGHFISNDDDSEIFILFSCGQLNYIKFIVGDLLVTVTESNITITPLIIEIEEDETAEENLQALKELSNVEILERNQEQDLQLHAFVEKELSALCGSKIEILEEADWESYKVLNQVSASKVNKLLQRIKKSLAFFNR